LLPGSWTLVAAQQALAIKQDIRSWTLGIAGTFSASWTLEPAQQAYAASSRIEDEKQAHLLSSSWTLEAVQQQVLLDSWSAGHKRLYSRQFLYQAAGH
jgi:hypothetical protein